MNTNSWLSGWLSKKTFWQFNVAFGLAFIALYIFKATTTQYFMYRFQVSLSDWAEVIGLESKFDLLELMVALTVLSLFLAIRYGKLANKLKINAVTLYIILAANISILLFMAYGSYFPVTEQLSAFGLGGLLSVMTRICLALGSISFLIPLIWHYVIKPHAKIKAFMITLFQPLPYVINDVQSKRFSKNLAIGVLIGLALMILSIYKQEVVKYMRMEKEIFSEMKNAEASSDFSIGNWKVAVEITKPALAAEKSKDWWQAISLWNRLNKSYPYDASVLEHRAEAYHQLAQYEKARQDLKASITLGGNDAGKLTDYCWNTVLSQHLNTAISVCTRAQQYNPWRYTGSLNLGHAYLFNNDLKRANLCYDKAISQIDNEEDLAEILNDFKLFKNLQIPASQIEQLKTELDTKGHARLNILAPINALLKQAENAEQAGNFKEAVSLYEQRIEALQNLIGHQNSQIYPDLSQLALLQTSMGQYQQAENNLKILQKLIAQDLGAQHAKMSDVLNYYGHMLYSAGRYDEAIQVYQKAVNITTLTYGDKGPYMATRLNGLGSAYRKKEELDLAYKPANQAVDISLSQLLPDYQMAAKRVNNLGLILEETGNLESANYYFTQALSMTVLSVGPDHIDVCQRLHNLGNVLVKLKRYDEADRMFRLAMKIADEAKTPNNKTKTTAILDLIELLTLTGRKDEAKLLNDRIIIIEQAS